MVKNKTVITKIVTPGAMRQSVRKDDFTQRIDKRATKIACSAESDGVTTYVQLKEWDIETQNYLYPPYVECEYVE